MSWLVVGGGRLGRAVATRAGFASVEGRAGDDAFARAVGDAARDGAPCVLIAVADAHVASVAARLAGVLPGTPDAVVLHASGALAADADGPLAPCARRGAAVGALHVLRAVPRDAPDALVGAPCAVSGDARAIERAREAVALIGGAAFELPSNGRDRALYHAAASLVAGGVVALVDAGLELCSAAGVAPDAARVALADLAASAARNVAAAPPAEALTGPFARGDAATVAAHVGALGGAGADLDLYRAVGHWLLAYTAAGLDAETRERLARALGGT